MSQKSQKLLIIITIASTGLLLHAIHKFHRDENTDHKIMLSLIGKEIPQKLTSLLNSFKQESSDLKLMRDLLKNIDHQLQEKKNDTTLASSSPLEVFNLKKELEIANEQLRSNFIINSNFIPVTPPYHLPPRIRKNPDLEALFCANGTYDCIDFPEVTRIPTKLSDMDFSTYSKIINLPSKHTNPYECDFNFLQNKSHIKLEIIPKDSERNRKQYLGDYWIARIVPTDEATNVKEQTSDENFGTFIQMEIKEVGSKESDNLRYQVIQKLNHPLFMINENTKNYTLQLYFIRSSEMSNLHRRVLTKMKASTREWFAQFENIPGTFECSPLASFLLKENFQDNTTCAISSQPGREFYCKNMPTATACRDNKLLKLGYKTASSTSLGTLLNRFNPDPYYENLVFEQSFLVDSDDLDSDDLDSNDLDSDDPESKLEISENLYAPYWNQTIYKDPKVPLMTNRTLRRSIYQNKIFVSVGDSLNWQVINFLERDADTPGENFVETSWEFLGLESDDILCGPVLEYAPRKRYFKHLNATFYHIWHGNPLHNPWDGHKKFSCPLIQHTAGEILDRMVEHGWVGEEYVFFLDVGVHLAIFNPIVTYRRLVDVRRSAEKWVKASEQLNMKPGLVIYKGMLYNRGNLNNVYTTVSSTILRRIQELAEFIFEDSCVKVFDFWAFSETVFDHQRTGEIHPGRGEGTSKWIMTNVINRFVGLLAREL